MKEILPNILARKLKPSDNRWKINGSKLCVWKREQLSDLDIREIDLPPGSYEILFTTKDCTDWQIRSIVKSHYSRSATLNLDLGHYQSSSSCTTFMDYENGFCTLDSPAESLQSLLRSHGLDENNNYLLLKKIS